MDQVKYVTVTADTLWLKPREAQEKIQAWLHLMGVKPEDCAEFTVILGPNPRARFTLYDRDDKGNHYMVAGQAAAFMETRKVYNIPSWIENYFAAGYLDDPRQTRNTA